MDPRRGAATRPRGPDLRLLTPTPVDAVDPTGYYDVRREGGVTIVERKVGLSEIDLRHLYEPGPAKRALADLLRLVEPGTPVLRRPDGSPVSASEMLTMLQADTPEGERARRGALEQALAGEVRGLAFFGHGAEDRLLDASGTAALDERNLACVRGRWVHAFACRAGDHLAGPAAAAGVHCFVGYESALNVDWSPDEIPGPIREAFIRLVTQTTLELARGVLDGDVLRRAALEAQAIVIQWCDEHPGDATGLEIMAQ